MNFSPRCISTGGPSAGGIGLLVAVLLLAAVLCRLASVPPAVVGGDAPAGLFSTQRAMADVRAVGRLPHPVGSAEHERVRAVLFARMAALGLAPRMLGGTALKVAGARVSGADVTNLLGRLRGTDPRAPAVLLMAHYDSVPSSSGAADDGVGLAAGLEVVRALRTGPPPRRDVLLLFTDGEENGLLGARAFFASGEARRIGFVINMDMRGGAGRAIMHETGQRAGGAVALYRRSAVHPTGDSIAGYVERLIRNSSDFRIAQDAGLIGLNFAILDRQFDYHAASSTPATLDPRSLQHVGEQALAATRLAANLERLPGPAPDPAFASLLGWRVLAYPTWAGWLVLAAGLACAGLAWRRAPVTGAALARGAAAAFYLLLLLVILSELARFGTGVPAGFAAVRPLLARWDRYEAALILIGAAGIAGWWAMALAGARRWAVAVPLLAAAAFVLIGGAGWVRPVLALAAALLAIPAFARPLAARATGFGLWIAVAVVAVAIQATAPLAGVIAGWSVAGGGAMILAAGIRRPWGLLLAALIAVPLIAQQLATGHLLLLTVGDTLGGVAGPFGWFVALSLAPLLACAIGVRGGAGMALACGLAATALVASIRLVDPASAARPGLSQILHVADLADGRFYRATGLATPDRWTDAALGGAGGAGPLLPIYDHAFVRRTGRVAVTPPQVVATVRPDGLVLLRIAAPPGAREIGVAMAATAPMARLWVNGRRVPLLARPGAMARLYWYGRDPVVTVVMAPSAPGRLVARIATLRDGWPADTSPLPPRPPTSMPWYDSDATVTLSTTSISW